METGPEIDRLLLGSNPLWGTSHYLAEKGRPRFGSLDFDAIARVIRASMASGAKGFTFTLGPSVNLALSILKRTQQLEPLGLYPLAPSGETVTRLLRGGTVAMVSEALRDLSWSGKARLVIRGGWTWLTRNPESALGAYLDMEISKLIAAAPSNARLKGILLHELFTDSIVALDAVEIFEAFVKLVRSDHSVYPGFETRNLPKFSEFIRKTSVKPREVMVMSPFNPIGFQMTPTRESCEAALAGLSGAKMIAMSILAGGRLQLVEAIRYLRTIAGLSSVAVGLSTVEHAVQTFSLLRTQL